MYLCFHDCRAMSATCYIHDVMDTSIADAYSMQQLVEATVVSSNSGGSSGSSSSGSSDSSSPASPPRLVPYREYLQHHRQDTRALSGHRGKFHALQASIADHFLVLEGVQTARHSVDDSLTKKQLYIQQEHRHLGGSETDIARYNVEALRIVQSLLLFGFYSDKKEMMEAVKICFVAIKYHIKLLHPDIDTVAVAAEEDDGDSFDGSDDSSTTSSLEDEAEGLPVPYCSLVQNEIPHRDERDDWRYFMNLENEAFDQHPSDEDDDIIDSHRSSFTRRESSEGAQSDLLSADLPSADHSLLSSGAMDMRYSRQGSVDTAVTDTNSRGLYITRLCVRHDQVQRTTVCREHIQQNQR
jgi:hypothetical protein